MVPVCVPQPALPVARANGACTPPVGPKRLDNVWTDDKAKPGVERCRTTGLPYSAAVASTLPKRSIGFYRDPGVGLTLVYRFGEGHFSHREGPIEDPLNRCSELQPQNSMVTLHLKSCYAVETQEGRLPPNAVTAEASCAYPCVSGAADELNRSSTTATGSSAGGENNAKRWGRTTSPVIPRRRIGRRPFSSALKFPSEALPRCCQCPETLAPASVEPGQASTA